MEAQDSFKMYASQECTSHAIAAESYISSTNDQAHSAKGDPPVSLSKAPWAAGQIASTELSESACDARGEREKNALCMHGGASPPGDRLSIAAFQGHQLAPERLWFEQNAVDRQYSDPEAYQLPEYDEGQDVPSAAHPRSLHSFSAPEPPAAAPQCTCNDNDQMYDQIYKRRCSVRNARNKNASLLHQAYRMSHLYSPMPLPCKKHFPGSGTWKSSNSIHIASQVLQGIQAPNREFPGTSVHQCESSEQDTHTSHLPSSIRRFRSLSDISYIASGTGSISSAASCSQAKAKRQNSRLSRSSVRFGSLPASEVSQSQSSGWKQVLSSSNGSPPTALLRSSHSQPAPGGRSHPHSHLERFQSSARAVSVSLKSGPKPPPAAVKDSGRAHMQNCSYSFVENPSQHAWCTSTASDGAPLPQHSRSLKSSTGNKLLSPTSSCQDICNSLESQYSDLSATFLRHSRGEAASGASFSLPCEFHTSALRPPLPSTSASSSSGGPTLSYNRSWESSMLPDSTTASTIGAMSIQAMEEGYGVASASGKLARTSQDSNRSIQDTNIDSRDTAKQHTLDNSINAQWGLHSGDIDKASTDLKRERYKDVFRHAKDTKGDSKSSVDASENIKDVLEKYLDLNAYVSVRYEATEEQKNDPAYAHLVRALPLSVTGEVAPRASQQKRYLRVLDTWHEDSGATNRQPASPTVFARILLTIGGFRKLLCACGGHSAECSGNLTQMKRYNSNFSAARSNASSQASSARTEVQHAGIVRSMQASPSGILMSLSATKKWVEGGDISAAATSDTPAGTSLNRTAEPTLTRYFGLPSPDRFGLDPIQESSMRDSAESLRTSVGVRPSEERYFRH